MSVEVRACPHCYFMESMGVSHTKVCNCTHHHADHNFAAGCRIPGCLCECYSQAERAVRATKIVHQEPVEHVDVVELMTKAQKQDPSELVVAQARLDSLRNKKKQVEELCEKAGAKST